MARLSKLLSAGAIVASFSVPAFAADLAYPPAPRSTMVPAPGAEVAELGTGWYLRGDIGYLRYSNPKDADASPDLPVLRDLKFQDTYSAGGGIGYKFTDWFRGDVTADFRGSSKFSDWSSGSYDRIVRGSTETLAGRNVEKGDFSGTLVLANAYVDLGTWYGITPYVGAGAGAAERRFSAFSTQTTCFVDKCDGASPIGPLPAVLRADLSKWSFAWALMGGVSVNLGAGFSLDAGYRYVNLGKAESGYDVGITDPARTRLKDIDSHEVRLGIRYMIDSSF